MKSALQKFRAWYHKDPTLDPAFWQGYLWGSDMAVITLEELHATVYHETANDPQINARDARSALLALAQAIDTVERCAEHRRIEARKSGKPA